MVITALGQGTAASALYPEFVGRRGIFVGTSAGGPASYSQTTGDPVTLSKTPYYIDAFAGDALTVSGTYVVRFRPAATGVRQSWTAFWFVAATGLPVANATVLSAERIQVGIFGGQF